MRPRVIGLTALLVALIHNVLNAQVVLSPTHYDVRFDVDYDAGQLKATTRINLRNPSTAPVREASLLLYRLLRVRAVRDDRGRGLSFTQAVVAFEDFAQLQVNQLLVTLPEPLAPGKQVAVEVRYDGHLLGYAETGMRYIQDRIDTTFTILRDDSYAFPRPGFPSEKVNRSVALPEYSYSARITVPIGLKVANGGRFEGADTVGQAVTFRYESLKPSWRMDFAIARYTELRTGSVRVLHLPGDGPGASGVVQAAEAALDRFTRWFGERRDPTPLTFIEVPDGWGSQADVTTIIQSAAAFKDSRRRREVYHEISHLWNVEPSDRPSPRWGEGLASFLEDLVNQDVAGQPILDARANQLVEWLRGQLPTHPRWRTVPLADYGRAGLTDLSYSVGNLYFDLLYRLAGQDGFNKIIAGFATECGDRGCTTKEFADFVRRTAVVDLSRLNNDWFLTTGWADRVAQGTTINELAAYYRRAGGRELRTTLSTANAAHLHAVQAAGR